MAASIATLAVRMEQGTAKSYNPHRAGLHRCLSERMTVTNRPE
jgi:hypothetical protein